jgi:hypothetical protein
LNTYSRLLGLYKTNMTKTPMEDFVTEILVAILENNSEIGYAFATQMLKLNGDSFFYRTQDHFTCPDPLHSDCRIDIVVRSEGLICFLENKVEADTGYIQFERYASVLRANYSDHRTKLAYCTKYFDTKEIEEHDFHQFRWANVYKFLQQWNSIHTIQEFLEFLKEHNMSDELDFDLNDLIALRGINPVIRNMDLYLEKLQPVFGKYFDLGNLKQQSGIKQLKEHSRFIFYGAAVFGQGGWSELGVGFDCKDVPAIKVWVRASDGNSKAAALKATIQQPEGLETNKENWIGLTAPLTDFMSSEHMEEDIEKWFHTAFKTIKTFMESTAELDWHL